jgi:hypothetical protein
MRRRYLLHTSLLILLLAALPAGAVTLRYSLSKGTEITYRVQIAAASRMTDPAGEKVEINTWIDQTFRLRVLEVSPEGEMEAEQEVISGRLKIASQGEEKEGPLPTARRRFRISPLGRVVRAAAEEPEEPSNAASASADSLDLADLPADIEFLVSGIFLPLPEREVDRGDSWEEEFEVRSVASLPLLERLPEKTRLKVKSRLLELKERDGRKSARIRTNYELPMYGERPLAGLMFGETEWYFDYEQGCVLAAEGILQVLFRMPEGSPPETTSSAMKVNLKARLVER